MGEVNERSIEVMNPIENEGGVSVKELFEGHGQITGLFVNNLSPMSLKGAVELGRADIIHSHGKPTKTSNPFRFMRLLVHMGLFSKTKVGGGKRRRLWPHSYFYTAHQRQVLLLVTACFRNS